MTITEKIKELQSQLTGDLMNDCGTHNEIYKLKIELAKEQRCSKATYFASSGGLKGNAWINRYGHIEGLRLEFVLTEWDSDGDF